MSDKKGRRDGFFELLTLALAYAEGGNVPAGLEALLQARIKNNGSVLMARYQNDTQKVLSELIRVASALDGLGVTPRGQGMKTAKSVSPEEASFVDGVKVKELRAGETDADELDLLYK